MIRFVFTGESFFEGEGGFRETLESNFIVDTPQNDYEFIRFHQSGLTLEKVLSGLPLHVIGKNPDVILFNIGYQDLLNHTEVETVFKRFEEIVQMVADKTNALVFYTNISTPLIKGDSDAYNLGIEFNLKLAEMYRPEKMVLIDLDKPVGKFIERHSEGEGEKRSLLKSSDMLSNLGKVVISRLVFKTIKSEMKKENLWKS